MRAHALLAVLLSGLAAPAAVTVERGGNALEIDNGRVALRLSTTSGDIVSARLDGGPELVAAGRSFYFDANGSGPVPSPNRAGYWKHSKPEVSLARETEGLAEVTFRGGGGDVFPFTVTLGYVVRDGEPGFHVWVHFAHAAGAPPGGLGQTRYVLRVNRELFAEYQINDATHGAFPTGPAVRGVTDATSLFADGRIATKYNLADFEAEHRLHGAYGRGHGLWVIRGSNEYLNGGPTKQNLTVHEDEPLVLSMLHSGHFQTGSGVRAEGAWSKLYGPFFVYLNRAESREAAWADATARAEAEVAAWPCQWMRHPDFPLGRATVSGRIERDDGAPAAGAMVILGAPDPDWPQQCAGYLWWARAAADGSFRLPGVRPGRYTAYVWQSGEIGQSRRDDVEVTAGAMELGTITFAPERFGRLVWQVGTPDRSAGEFRYGDAPRQFGLWNRYPADFPHDVTYIIGASAPRLDWNYCQPVVRRADGAFHLPVWRIRFDLAAAPTGRARLSFPLAGASREPALVVEVNGTEIHRSTPPSDPSVYRDGNQAGMYRQVHAEFEATLLRAGANEVTLRLEKRLLPAEPYDPLELPLAAVMYDAVRLELTP